MDYDKYIKIKELIEKVENISCRYSGKKDSPCFPFAFGVLSTILADTTSQDETIKMLNNFVEYYSNYNN